MPRKRQQQPFLLHHISKSFACQWNRLAEAIPLTTERFVLLYENHENMTKTDGSVTVLSEAFKRSLINTRNRTTEVEIELANEEIKRKSEISGKRNPG